MICDHAATHFGAKGGVKFWFGVEGWYYYLYHIVMAMQSLTWRWGNAASYYYMYR